MINIVYNGEREKTLLKEVIGETMPRLAAEDPMVVYLDADLKSCVGLAKWDSDRSINCGIAEANMVGVASGMSLMGFKPYVHSFGTFSSRRCFDQVFLSSGYANCPITVLGSDPGVTAAYNGGTHMPFEDIATYMMLPNSTIIDITDATMLRSILEQVKDMPGVKYIRFNRKNMHKVFADGSDIEIGKAITLHEGKDAVVFACGIMVHEAMQAANILAKDGISVAVVNIHTIKPIDEKAVIKYAKRTGAVVTAENHSVHGGLGSVIAGILSRKLPTPMECVAVEDEYGEVGPLDYLQERFGLTSENIVKKVRAVLARKS